MSVQYIAVTWNRQKRIYDLIVGFAVVLLVGIFFVVSFVTHPHMTAETGLIRGLGLTALLLLHIILCIGPLCRLNPAFLPLLYNRRHLGVAMTIVALAQPPFAAASFEFGHPRTISGRVVPGAYLTLEVTDGNRIRRYLLAAAGKHGAGPMTAPHDGRNVALVGTLIHRGNAAMLEIAPITAADDTTARPARQQVDFGRYTLTGEIVDAKCWLGVMNPGEGKTHLGCTVRCLSGGLPPLLVIRDSTGAEQHLILTDERGGPMPKSVLPDVGRPVRVAGRVVGEGDLLFIEAAREAVERIR